MVTERLPTRRSAICLAAALLWSGTGCGTSTGGDGGTGPTPAIAISIGTAALTIPAGGSQDLTATITRSGGFTGVISLETEGAPTGVSAFTSGITTIGTITTGTVTVTVAASTAPGTYQLIVRASGQGVTSVTQPVALTVPVPPTPSIAVALSPAGQGLQQGTTGAPITVTITKTSIPGAVTLVLEGAPPGMTATFDPAQVVGATSSLTITASAAVPEGTYNLTVRATAAGAADATAPLQVVVSIPSSYTISVPDVAINQQGQADVTVTLTRFNHASPVTLSLEAAPAGVTGSFNPAAPVGPRTSTLTIRVAASTPPGPHVVTVRGTTADLADRTTTFVLTVIAQAQGNYALSTQPSGTVSVSRGGGGMALVAVLQRSVDFTQPVTLSVSGAPPGLTVTVPPDGSTATRMPISISAAAGLPPGPYPITITGSTPNLADRQVSLTVVVNLGNLTLDYSGCPGNFPLFVAAQDGKSGPWIRLVPQNGVFLTRLTSTLGGIASVLAGPGGTRALQVQLGTTAELQALRGSRLCGTTLPPGSKTVTAPVSGLGQSEQALVSLGGVTRPATSALPNPVLAGILDGPQDLVAVSSPLTGGFSSNKYIFRSSLDVVNGGAVAPIDFASAEALDPLPATATISGLTAGETLASVGTAFFSGPRCTMAPLWSVPPGGGSTTPIYGLQPSANGVHRISVTTSGNGRFRSVDEYLTAFSDWTIVLGSDLPVPTVTALPANYRRLRFQLGLPPDLTATLSAFYGNASLTASAGWLGGPAASMGMPDFLETAGWDDSFAPSLSGQPVDWIVAASSLPVGNPCAGGRMVAANLTGMFVP
jgi:uncharacterized membrane protein